MNNVYDSALNETGLAWLPWVGSGYVSLPSDKKVLFVGESHYFNSSGNKNEYNDRNVTRRIVKDMGVNGNDWGSPFFENILRMIFSNSKLTVQERESFWNNISFYNFVQIAMDTKKGRPSKEDFIEGWKVFYEVIKILKPRACIFLGISAGNYYKQGSKFKNGLKLNDNYQWGEAMFGRSRSIFLEFTHPDGEITSLYFVKHPSSYFSPKKSEDFLNAKNPEMLKFLKKTKLSNVVSDEDLKV